MKIVNNLQWLIIFAKSSILDVWQVLNTTPYTKKKISSFYEKYWQRFWRRYHYSIFIIPGAKLQSRTRLETSCCLLFLHLKEWGSTAAFFFKVHFCFSMLFKTYQEIFTSISEAYLEPNQTLNTKLLRK